MWNQSLGPTGGKQSRRATLATSSVLFGISGITNLSTPYHLLAQGCNLALESVRVFAQSLDAVDGDLDRAPTAFTAARLEDVHAMQKIEYMQVREWSVAPLLIMYVKLGRQQKR